MTQSEYFLLPWYAKLLTKTVNAVKAFITGIISFFKNLPKNVSSFFKKIGNGFKNFGRTFAQGGLRTKLSYFIMGAGNLFRGQIIRGLLFLEQKLLIYGI
ncbi:MAG: hypothetical protein ACI4I1_12515 [Oscillospiraceae bacterium]